MQLVVSVALVVIGLGLVFLGPAGDFRVFGWVVLAVGLLGLVVRAFLARQER
jgi:hypothetical protein